MIKIELGQETSFEVEIGGKVYNLREPSVEEIDRFRDSSADQGTNIVTQFLSTIGMPEDVVKKLPMSKARRLIDGMMDELTKKK